MRVAPRLTLFMGLLASASAAIADCNTAELGRICTDVAITRTVASEDGGNSIQISAAAGGLACTATGGYLNVDMTKPYAPALYAQLLSAYLTRQRVTVRLSDSIEACTVVYSWIDQ